MAEKDKRYYWLKLKRDFFKRHDIRIIENMPNGKDYILFYLKLLCESVDHNGNLRFSDNIPYNEEMLATITNTNVDIVRSAVKIFNELNMMEIMTDGTYYMSEVNKMIGSETYWAEQKRKQRSTENEFTTDNSWTMSNEIGQFPTCPSKSKSKSKSIEIDIDKDIDKDIDISTNVDNIHSNECIYSTQDKKKPVKHQRGEYKKVLLTDDEYKKLVAEFGQDKTEQAIKFLDEYIAEKGYKSKSHYLAMRRWVFKAIEEKAQKGKATNKTAQQLDSFYQMAMEWSRSDEEGTI